MQANITPARKRRAIRYLREWTSGLLGLCGFALLASWACGMDYSIWLRDQVMIWAGGAALIGLAYLVYPEKHGRKEQTDGTIEEAIVETVHAPKP